jgi:hypothetical protein
MENLAQHNEGLCFVKKGKESDILKQQMQQTMKTLKR